MQRMEVKLNGLQQQISTEIWGILRCIARHLAVLSNQIIHIWASLLNSTEIRN